MDEENKFYRSKLLSQICIIWFILILLFVAFFKKNFYMVIEDNFLFLIFAFPVIVVVFCFFVYWLISLRNAKKSYIEFFTQSMIIDNYYGVFKMKEELYEIKYDEIKEVKIFPIHRDYCHHVNIHKKHSIWEHDIICFELKISDNTRFIELLNLYWVNVSKQSYF